MILHSGGMHRPNFGDFWIGRIEDFKTPGGDPADTFPQYDEEGWRRGSRLIPDSSWATTGAGTVTRHGTWIIVADARVILIDTSLGNRKRRPRSPSIDNLETDYLDRLLSLNLVPESVDAVVITHLHPDHVGWNTVFDDGAWRPAFPNATYYLPLPDLEFWRPESAAEPVGRTIMENVFADSVAPVLEHSKTHVWSYACEVAPGVVLEPAPGHTPGTSVVKLRTADGELAAFIGDILHSPVQIHNPHWSHRFCEDQSASADSRRAVLNWASQTRAVVLAAHFGANCGFYVEASGSTYTISEWRPFASDA